MLVNRNNSGRLQLEFSILDDIRVVISNKIPSLGYGEQLIALAIACDLWGGGVHGTPLVNDSVRHDPFLTLEVLLGAIKCLVVTIIL